MTTQEIIDYYANLLIVQYVVQPGAYATIQTTATPFIMDQLPLQIQNAFQIGTSVGVQLDVIGKYVGVTRYGTGLNNQAITLNDADFTQLIQMAIIQNNSGSSLATIQQFLQQYFPNEVFVYDSANMQMSYLISSSVGSQNLVELFVQQGLLPKPMGVQLASVIYIAIVGLYAHLTYDDFVTIQPWSSTTTYAAGDRVFGSSDVVYSSLIDGNLDNVVTNATYWEPFYFQTNSYDSYNDAWTWLTYDDTITL